MQSTADAKRSERICENGSYFCKRDRNKVGTIGIYTYDKKKRQTVPVGDTGESSPEGEVIDEKKLGRIELALARFVVTNVEAIVRQRDGIITKVDMFVKECITRYALARDAFHAEVVKKVGDLLAEADARQDDGDRIVALRFQVKRAQDAARKERASIKFASDNINRAWPEEGPTVSAMDQAKQLHFVKVLKGIGYANNTILMAIRITRSSLHHCATENLLLHPVPKAVSKKKWLIKTDEDRSVVAYKLPEMAVLFNAAARQETWWRYLNLSTHAPRLMTIIEAPWMNFTLDDGEEPRWKLNPPGKRITSKRRPVIPLCPTLVAELHSWKRDAVRVVSDGKGKAIEGALIFKRLRRASGLKRGTAKSVRAFIRTWLAVNGVPETIADWFVGHADGGSETGQEFYKDKQPEYMKACVDALEKLYEALRPLVTVRRFKGGFDITEDQPDLGDFENLIPRGSCVAKLIATG